MKKALCAVLLLAVAFTGCGRKEAEKKEEALSPARKFLIEGTVYLKQGEPVKAVGNFAMAMKTDPDLFEAYYLMGETFIRLKQYEQASSVMNAAVQRFPENGVAFYMLALAYDGMDQTAPAIVAARKSLDLFAARKDEDSFKRATILLAALVAQAKQKAEDQMVANAAKDAQTAVAARQAAATAAAAAEVKPVETVVPAEAAKPVAVKGK